MALTLGRPSPPRHGASEHGTPHGLLGWITTTDHKRIGLLYIGTAFAFFVVGGVLASLMRLELAEPGRQVVDEQQYSQLFTMHGSVMMFLFAVPMASGLANYLVPLHVGAPDMAFPRLNALSYWLFVGGGLVMLSGFLTEGGAADFGWTAYTPLSSGLYSPGNGADLWLTGLALLGVATTLTAINVVATVLTLRAPGMTMFRMPIFTWTFFVTSLLVLLGFPVITAGIAMLFVDRQFGGAWFDPARGGDPILWQHLFWFFGHPEVYIVALPFFGVISEVVPVFSRRPLFGYKAFVLATLAIGAYSVATWAHHMYATGAVYSSFFAATTLIIAVPTGVKIFNWIATMLGGHIVPDTPMLFAISFIIIFLIGGLTGPMLAIPSFDLHVTDTYFVVAHMHYVLLGSAVFAMFAGLYFWWPKFYGHRLRESWGRAQAALLFVGFNITFFPQHLLGLRGMPRRYADYPADAGFTWLNLLSSIGALLMVVAVSLFLVNIWISRHDPPAGDDPWGGNSLEWATTSPPPVHNFDRVPPVRSERPAHDLAVARAAAAAAADAVDEDGTGPPRADADEGAS
ncbi:cytochrome c oxidase subunit I [Dermatobacter hominis]|uniref:cytochrome c oxidase subunit I n=1 Tax=Dermatobacter hominis TaxID=2884263 RepID=UPI001D1172C5|nr:cytochrome c oxidase subunit I [Dermatobacter hominis]UDY34163.1 cytochrome c oxidase subunit I [Dermatobacter hominis]